MIAPEPDPSCVRCGYRRISMVACVDTDNMRAPRWPVCGLCARHPAEQLVRELSAALLVAAFLAVRPPTHYDDWLVYGRHLAPGASCRSGRPGIELPDRLMCAPGLGLRHKVRLERGEPYAPPRVVDLDEFAMTHALNDG